MADVDDVADVDGVNIFFRIKIFSEKKKYRNRLQRLQPATFSYFS